jgi:hypothetical protein
LPMKSLRKWIEKRRLDKAQEIIESYGLSVVKMKTVGGSTYIVNADGTYLKLVKASKK